MLTLVWKQAHINNIIHRAFIRLRLILECFRSRDKRILTRAYCTYVRPILEYCSPVWSPQNKQLIAKIERVQRFFTRAIPGLRTLPYRSRLQKLGLQTLEHRRLIHDLCLITKYYTNSFIAPSPNFPFSCHLAHVVIPSVYVKKNAPPLTGSISSSIASWNLGTLCPQILSAPQPIVDLKPAFPTLI